MKWPLFVAGVAIFLASVGCGQPSPWFGAKEADLIGTYKFARSDNDATDVRGLRETKTEITLHSNHQANVTELPQFDMGGDNLTCSVSGPARWEVSGDEVILHFPGIPENARPLWWQKPRACNQTATMRVSGRFSPFGLYIYLNPDLGKGLAFSRVSR